MSQPPGWYPSPQNSGKLQWWNGNTWAPDIPSRGHHGGASPLTESQIENSKLAPGESRVASKRKYTKRAVAYVLIGASLLGVSGAFAHPVFSGDYSVTSGTVSSINESTYRTNGSASRKSCTSVVTFNVDGNTYTAIDDSSSAGSCLVKIGDTKEVRYNRSDIEGTASAVSDHTVHLRIWGTLAVGLSAITAGVLTWRSGAPTIVTRRTDGTFTTKSPKK